MEPYDDLPLYRLLASLMEARENCARSGNTTWLFRHTARIASLCEEYLPCGAGLDDTTFDIEASSPNKLVIHTSFHHMNEHGVYDGWTDHNIIVKACLAHGLTISVGGSNRDMIKEYLHEIFYTTLTIVVPRQHIPQRS